MFEGIVGVIGMAWLTIMLLIIALWLFIGVLFRKRWWIVYANDKKNIWKIVAKLNFNPGLTEDDLVEIDGKDCIVTMITYIKGYTEIVVEDLDK